MDKFWTNFNRHIYLSQINKSFSVNFNYSPRKDGAVQYWFLFGFAWFHLDFYSIFNFPKIL